MLLLRKFMQVTFCYLASSLRLAVMTLVDSDIVRVTYMWFLLSQEKAAAEMWQSYLVLTAPLSQQLCEQLRLILEPTQAAKLK